MGQTNGSPDGDKSFQMNFNLVKSQNDFKYGRSDLCLTETVALLVARNQGLMQKEDTGVLWDGYKNSV